MADEFQQKGSFLKSKSTFLCVCENKNVPETIYINPMWLIQQHARPFTLSYKERFNCKSQLYMKKQYCTNLPSTG